jgi:hypothetical protein
MQLDLMNELEKLAKSYCPELEYDEDIDEYQHGYENGYFDASSEYHNKINNILTKFKEQSQQKEKHE